jgi:hypothetical protein
VTFFSFNPSRQNSGYNYDTRSRKRVKNRRSQRRTSPTTPDEDCCHGQGLGENCDIPIPTSTRVVSYSHHPMACTRKIFSEGFWYKSTSCLAAQKAVADVAIRIVLSVIVSESHLEVDRRNLKIINFKHEFHLGVKIRNG